MPGEIQQNDQTPPFAIMAVGALVLATAGFWLLIHGNMSLLLTLLFAGCLFGIYLVSRDTALFVTLVFLLFLGDIRRVWGWLYGFPDNDPLIVVGGIFAFAVATPVLFRSRYSDSTSKICLGLIFVMFLQVFNPAQGGLIVGLTGMLFTMAPLMWFWIGRTFGGDTMLRTLLQKILVPVALIASVYGRYQNLFGLNAWQQAWIDHVGSRYSALHLGHSIRSFGFSSSSSEYINMLGMATIVAMAGFLGGRRIMILPLSILLPSLFLASSRGTFVRVLFAGAIAFSFTGRKKGASTLRFVLAIALSVGGIALAVSGYGNDTKGPSETAAQAAVAHQIEGLRDPLHSTAVGHTGEILGAIGIAVRHPTGYGLGSTSIASKLGEGQESAGSSEFDLTDAFLALGLPGGLLYLGFIAFMYRDSIRYISFGPKDLSLPVFGILAAFLGDWLFPGEYANGPILWLAAGCVVRAVAVNREAIQKAKREAALLQEESSQVLAAV